jgi:upstream activation factor subunit UAF30
MAKHKMTFTLPEREIGQGDVIFNIFEDGEKFGTVKISKGALEWFPIGHKKPYTLGWKRFDNVITNKENTSFKPKAKRLPKKARKPIAAFSAKLTSSKSLAAVVGSKPQSRTQIIKKIWGYILKHKLQDSKNKKLINADRKLTVLFGGKKQISMFELAKVVNNNVK